MADTFSVSEVSAVLGVSVPTLRSWERRYGWPRPTRTTGGHRRYSLQELDDLKRICEMSRETRISVAIRSLGAPPPTAQPTT
ncbi:MAG: MerR family transcriptional regulator [Actinobacteria bacterium]|nr:MerR family transcriptional regulator [Actinomycetota bacterium]